MRREAIVAATADARYVQALIELRPRKIVQAAPNTRRVISCSCPDRKLADTGACCHCQKDVVE